MKVVITGGHPAPALAVIDYATSHTEFKDITFIFVGRKYNNQREKSLSFEYKEVKDRKLSFHNLETGRLTRILSIESIKNLIMFPIGFINAWRILKRIKPDRVLTFGGYLGLPVAYVAKKMNIPVFIHEQTIAPGLATEKISAIAEKVFVSFPESVKEFPEGKAILTGNLVRNVIFEKHTLPFSIPHGLPVIYVTGGSLGSHSVNVHIQDIIVDLVKDFVVIHQTGNIKEYDDFRKLQKVKEALPKPLSDRYIVLEHVQAAEIGSLFAAADIVVSRSGANTVTELIAMQKPSILIPLPWAARDEQLKQAKLLKKAGVAEIFDQTQSSGELLKIIHTVFKHKKEMKSRFTSLEALYNPHAPRIVLEAVLKN